MPVEGQGGFAGSGAVGRYWQTRCLGFEVRSERGRRLGRVESLELDRRTRAAVVLVVRRRRRKPLRLRSDAVSAVDPWRKALVVGLARPVRVDAQRVGRSLAPAARRVLLVLALAAWLYAQAVFALVRAVVRLVVALTVGTARGSARVRPHLHGAE